MRKSTILLFVIIISGSTFTKAQAEFMSQTAFGDWLARLEATKDEQLGNENENSEWIDNAQIIGKDFYLVESSAINKSFKEYKHLNIATTDHGTFKYSRKVNMSKKVNNKVNRKILKRWKIAHVKIHKTHKTRHVSNKITGA